MKELFVVTGLVVRVSVITVAREVSVDLAIGGTIDAYEIQTTDILIDGAPATPDGLILYLIAARSRPSAKLWFEEHSYRGMVKAEFTSGAT